MHLLHLTVAALLGFEDEAVALVEVDAAGAVRDVGLLERHRPLEDVGVLLVVGLRRVRALDPEHVAQLAEEELAVGTLGRARLFPARDEFRKRI